MINVLLVSPRLPPDDNRYGGDNAYTDTLLEYPPPGVRYYHYEDLIAAGQVRKLKWPYRIGPRLVRWGILPPDLWAEYLESHFIPDLVHIMAFSALVRFRSTSHEQVPIIIESPSGSISELTTRHKWSERKAVRAHRLKRLYLKAVGAYDSASNADAAARVIVQSQHSRHLHLTYGHVSPEKLVVLRPGVPVPPTVVDPTASSDHVTFLFVGGDFERKNGRLALEAFRRLHVEHPSARLILVGRPADGRTIEEGGVTHYLTLPRKEIFARIYPQADVLLFPTGAESGFAVVIYEAMNFGLAVITVDAWAMSEIVIPGETGLLVPHPPTADELVACMKSLVADREKLHNMRKAVLARFKANYSIEARQATLRQVYDEVLASAR
jgi:glycosyltransferase involved in cell wall biosynthesis